jgi:hypothetical protein
MALEKIRPKVVDETQNYVFNNVTATGNLTTLNANLGNLVSANYFTGVLITGAQPNITSVGTLGNVNVTSNVSAGNIKTDHLLYANGAAWSFATVSGSNTQVQFNNSGSFGSSANFTFDSTSNTLSVDNFVGNGSGLGNITGSNVTGQVPNSSIAGTVYTNAQPNITSVGTLTSVTISGNLTSGNANLGNLASANYFSGSGNLLSNIVGGNVTGQVSYAAVANSVAGANVSGAVTYAATANAVSGANVMGEVSYAAVANSVAVANVSGIGNIATINKDGNASNILYGNGVFASAPVTYGDSNVATYLPTYTGNLSPGNISISVANLFITGGTANYVLKTDGSGNLSWAEQSGGGSSTYTSVTVDNFTGDGTTTQFTLSVTPGNINQTFVNYNGALQLRAAYTLSGADIVFSEAPANGSLIEVTTTMGVTQAGGSSLTVRNYVSDGVQLTYTVSSGVTESSILVTENGLVQVPTTDYTVSGSTLTFVTAPGYGVKIQIRELTTAIATMTIPGSNTEVLFNNAGSLGNSAQFKFDASSNTLSVGSISLTGNIIPTANVTYNLGNSTNRFKDLFLSGSTIDLAGAQIKTDATTGAIALIPIPTANVPDPTGIIITASGTLSTVATTNGVANTSQLSSAIANSVQLVQPRFISMHTTGSVSGPSTGTTRFYPPKAVSISNIVASLSQASTTDFVLKIKKNDTQVNTYTVTANTNTMTKAALNVNLTTTDYLTVDIVSGSAVDLRVDLEYT